MSIRLGSSSPVTASSSSRSVSANASSRSHVRRRHSAAANSAVTVEQHVAAHFHFIQSDLNGVDKGAIADVDKLVDWAMVEAVVVPSETSPHCPICLDPIVVPTATQCGHLFCRVCITLYLTLMDKPRPKCPLCGRSVVPNTLKSVVLHSQTRVRVGDTVALTLLHRGKASATAAQVAPNSDPTLFARMSMTTDITPICIRELNELSSFAAVCDDAAQLAIVDMIRQQIAARLEAWHNRYPHTNDQNVSQLRSLLAASNAKTPIPETPAERAKSLPLTESEWPTLTLASSKPIKTLKPLPQRPPSVTPLSPPPPIVSPPPPPPPEPANPLVVSLHSAERSADCPCRVSSSDDYHWYQCADGQCLVVSALTYRLLLYEHEDVTRLPTEINGVVCDMEQLHVSPAFRNRFRFLAHLPLTALVSIATVDVAHLLSARTREHFADELAADERQRTVRRAEQRREEVAADKRLRKAESERAREVRQQIHAFTHAAFATPRYDTDVADTHDVTAFPSLTTSPTTSQSPPSPSSSVWSAVAVNGIATTALWTPLTANLRNTPPQRQTPQPKGKAKFVPLAL